MRHSTPLTQNSCYLICAQTTKHPHHTKIWTSNLGNSRRPISVLVMVPIIWSNYGVMCYTALQSMQSMQQYCSSFVMGGTPVSRFQLHPKASASCSTRYMRMKRRKAAATKKFAFAKSARTRRQGKYKGTLDNHFLKTSNNHFYQSRFPFSIEPLEFDCY